MLNFTLGLVTGVVFPFILYLFQRRIERRRESENLDRDQKRLDIITVYIENKDKWESSGNYVPPPASIADSVTKSFPPQQWLDISTRLSSHVIRAVHTACMYFEGISAKYPEYETVLAAHRSEFVKWYTAVHHVPAVFDNMPPLMARAIHAYYHRVTNPTESNVDGFYSAMTALQNVIDSGEIRVADDEIKRRLEYKYCMTRAST